MNEYKPKLFSVMKGYTKEQFFKDVIAGIIVAILMLAGGIVSIATRKSLGKGGNIALIVLFGLAAIIGFAGYGSFSDLAIWAGWCLINAVLAVVALVTAKKNN